MERSTPSLTNLYHLLYTGLILQNFLPTQGGGSSRCRLLEEEIFSPNFRGCFKFSSFTELVQRLLTCWLLFHPFDIFEGRVGLYYVEESLCTRYVNMECLQGSHSVPNLYFPCLYYSILLFQLSGSTSETIVDTF